MRSDDDTDTWRGWWRAPLVLRCSVAGKWSAGDAWTELPARPRQLSSATSTGRTSKGQVCEWRIYVVIVEQLVNCPNESMNSTLVNLKVVFFSGPSVLCDTCQGSRVDLEWISSLAADWHSEDQQRNSTPFSRLSMFHFFIFVSHRYCFSVVSMLCW